MQSLSIQFHSKDFEPQNMFFFTLTEREPPSPQIIEEYSKSLLKICACKTEGMSTLQAI